MRFVSRAVLTVSLAFSACARKETPPAPAEPDSRTEQRLSWFGEAASQPEIAWRSSGLGIRLLEPGSGTAPQFTDTVRVHYTGRLKDGTVFDDSRARGKPGDFVVNRLIPGWAAAMPSLKPGGRAEFYIPPHLGYGGVRAGNIPPAAGLIFDVELLAVNPPDANPR